MCFGNIENSQKVTEMVTFKCMLNVAPKWGLERRLHAFHRAVQRPGRMEYFLGIMGVA